VEPVLSSERPTILQIIPRLDAGGAERTVVEIADAIVKGGGRALVLTEGGRLASQVEAVGGEIGMFPAGTKNPVRLVANARALARIVGNERISLIHARSRAPAWSAMLAARRTRVPFVTTYHGAYAERNAAKRLYNSVMARGDVVIANSNYTARLLAQRYGTASSRIAVIPRGVDVAAFDAQRVAPQRMQALREQWRTDAVAPIVLHAARLTGWKGQSVLIAATGVLKSAGRLGNAVIVLAGDAQGRHGYVDQLQKQIAGLGLEPNVRMVGHIEDMPAAYLTANVTVIASTEPEAFGRTAVEAAAMGCPVIATDIGAPPETVLASPTAAEHELTGWLVPAGDVQALAETMGEALAMPAEQRLRLAARARAHVRQNFTTVAMQRRTLGVYDSLLSTTLGPRFDELAGVRDTLSNQQL
jgi:glycosyltransferase involved in cell wall biosynthesis